MWKYVRSSQIIVFLELSSQWINISYLLFFSFLCKIYWKICIIMPSWRGGRGITELGTMLLNFLVRRHERHCGCESMVAALTCMRIVSAFFNTLKRLEYFGEVYWNFIMQWKIASKDGVSTIPDCYPQKVLFGNLCLHLLLCLQ